MHVQGMIRKNMESKRIPDRGSNWADLKQQLTDLQKEDWSHRDGRLPLHCYFVNDEVSKVASEAYAMFSNANALAPQAFPSCQRMEQDIVSMVTSLLGGGIHSSGSITSGGTESIILAVKAARDYARAQRELRD